MYSNIELLIDNHEDEICKFLIRATTTADAVETFVGECAHLHTGDFAIVERCRRSDKITRTFAIFERQTHADLIESYYDGRFKNLDRLAVVCNGKPVHAELIVEDDGMQCEQYEHALADASKICARDGIIMTHTRSMDDTAQKLYDYVAQVAACKTRDALALECGYGGDLARECISTKQIVSLMFAECPQIKPADALRCIDEFGASLAQIYSFKNIARKYEMMLALNTWMKAEKTAIAKMISRIPGVSASTFNQLKNVPARKLLACSRDEMLSLISWPKNSRIGGVIYDCLHYVEPIRV